MRIGTLVAVPDGYSHFGRVQDENGSAYSVDEGDIPKDSKVGDQMAYKVEIWGSDGGLAYDLEK
jgi:hypothetical protein